MKMKKMSGGKTKKILIASSVVGITVLSIILGVFLFNRESSMTRYIKYNTGLWTYEFSVQSLSLATTTNSRMGLITVLPKGTIVNLLKESGIISYINVQETKQVGWVLNRDLTDILEKTLSAPNSAVSSIQNVNNEFIGTLVASGALRKCPSKSCEIIRYYSETAEVKITGIDGSNEWYKTTTKDDHGDDLNGWMHYSLFTQDYRDNFLKVAPISSEEGNVNQNKEMATPFFKNSNLKIGSMITFFVALLTSTILLRKNIRIILRSFKRTLILKHKSSKPFLFKIKVGHKSLATSILIGLVVFVTVAGISYGAIEYKKISGLVKESNQLVKEEKYSEANDKLAVAGMGLLVKTLGIKKQEINNQIAENKKLAEDKSSYDQGLDVLNNNNFQEAINILSTLPEDSFYYQKAQTKIEESKRMIVEGKLSVETTAKLTAEAKARQEEFEKKIKIQELADKEALEKTMNADNDGDGLTYREELAKGTSDWNTDSDGDGILDNLDSNPAGGGRNMPQYFSWSYGGYNWTWTVQIHEDWFDYYKDKNPRPNPRSADYITYNDPFIKAVAEKISETAKKNNLCITCLAASFIHSLSYVDDKYTGYDEYPKYPVETIIEKNGDCEDTSYLTASIIRAMNIDTVLILLPGHMAVGVWMDCDTSGTYYELNGRCYYYIETTNAKDWAVGEMPSDAPRTPATLIKIPSGETINNVYSQYVNPCDYSSDFSAYFDGSNFYTDSQCNNITYCLLFQGSYYNPLNKSFYWDSSCTQRVVAGCYKSTSYPGYFFNGIYWYYDSQCSRKANPH